MDEAADNNVKHFDGNPQNNINILILRQLSKAFPDSLGKEFLFRYICTNDNKITTYEVNIALSELLDTKLIEHTNPKPTNPLLALTVLFQEEPHFKITTEGLESFKQKTIDHPITHHQIEDGGNRVTKQDTPQRLEKPTSVQKPSTSNADIEVKNQKKEVSKTSTRSNFVNTVLVLFLCSLFFIIAFIFFMLSGGLSAHDQVDEYIGWMVKEFCAVLILIGLITLNSKPELGLIVLGLGLMLIGMKDFMNITIFNQEVTGPFGAIILFSGILLLRAERSKKKE